MGKHRVSTDRFTISVVLISAIVFTAVIGLLFLMERARKTEESCEPSEKSDRGLVNKSADVSFLTRKTRSYVECENLPPIPRCICLYCTKPPEERCIRWCSDNNDDDPEHTYPIDDIHYRLSLILNVTDCWMCTKTPVMSKNLPVTPIPVSYEDLIRVSKIHKCPEVEGTCKNVDGRIVEATYNLTRPPTIILAPHLTETIPICFLKEARLNVKPSLQVWTPAGIYTPYQETEVMHLGKVDSQKCTSTITPFNTYPPSCEKICTFDLDRDMGIGDITDEHREMLRKDLESNQRVIEKYRKKAINSLPCNECKNKHYQKQLNNTLSQTILDNEMKETHLGLMVLIHITGNIPFILPDGMYYICGEHAYKWLPVNSEGLCYIGKLIPQFYVLTHEELKKALTETSHRSKREIGDVKKQLTPLLHISTGHRVGISYGNIITYGNVGFMTNQYEIERLAGFLDNLTDIYDDTFRYVGHELQAFKTELFQHRLVLDYLTAQAGGYCLTLESAYGLHCCNYITNDTTNPEEVVTRHMNEAKLLKEKFRRKNYDEDSENDSWWEWLNPATWFSALGKRIANAIYSCLRFLFIILVIILGIYAAYKCIRCCIDIATKACAKKAEKIMITEIYTKV